MFHVDVFGYVTNGPSDQEPIGTTAGTALGWLLGPITTDPTHMININSDTGRTDAPTEESVPGTGPTLPASSEALATTVDPAEYTNIDLNTDVFQAFEFRGKCSPSLVLFMERSTWLLVTNVWAELQGFLVAEDSVVIFTTEPKGSRNGSCASLSRSK